MPLCWVAAGAPHTAPAAALLGPLRASPFSPHIVYGDRAPRPLAFSSRHVPLACPFQPTETALGRLLPGRAEISLANAAWGRQSQPVFPQEQVPAVQEVLLPMQAKQLSQGVTYRPVALLWITGSVAILASIRPLPKPAPRSRTDVPIPAKNMRAFDIAKSPRLSNERPR
jgi:hypothetical protein